MLLREEYAQNKFSALRADKTPNTPPAYADGVFVSLWVAAFARIVSLRNKLFARSGKLFFVQVFHLSHAAAIRPVELLAGGVENIS